MIHESLTVAAERDNLARVQEFITATMKEGCASEKAQNQIDIATEEVFINIASYAYPKDASDKSVFIDCVINGNEMTLTFKDKGVAYNPLNKPDPDINIPVQDMKIGGLGIFMTKQLVDSLEYEYDKGCNVLRIIKNIS